MVCSDKERVDRTVRDDGDSFVRAGLERPFHRSNKPSPRLVGAFVTKNSLSWSLKEPLDCRPEVVRVVKVGRSGTVVLVKSGGAAAGQP